MATLRPLHREEFGNELFLDGARPRSEHVAVRRSSNLRSRYQPLPAHLAQAGRAHVVLRSRVCRGRAPGQVSAPTELPTPPRYLSAWLVVHLQGGCRALPRGEGSPGTEVWAIQNVAGQVVLYPMLSPKFTIARSEHRLPAGRTREHSCRFAQADDPHVAFDRLSR